MISSRLTEIKTFFLFPEDVEVFGEISIKCYYQIEILDVQYVSELFANDITTVFIDCCHHRFDTILNDDPKYLFHLR